MDKDERMYKSYLARKKRKEAKEVVETVEKRKRADVKNLKKKYIKIKKKHHKNKCDLCIQLFQMPKNPVFFLYMNLYMKMSKGNIKIYFNSK